MEIADMTALGGEAVAQVLELVLLELRFTAETAVLHHLLLVFSLLVAALVELAQTQVQVVLVASS